MTELIQRVGYPMFIQMIIEFWNELILIMLTTIMLVGKSLDRRNELINKTKIPLTNELIFFYLAAFFYNMFDIISHYLSEYPKTHLMYVCAVFMYYAVGEFLDGEVRYNSLRRTFPENAKKLFAEGAALAKERYEKYKSMTE